MFEALVPLFPGGIPGGPELIVILLIAVLLFGANKIPKLARSTGQAMGEFQKGRQQVEDELKEMQEGKGAAEEEAAAAEDEEPETTTTAETTASEAESSSAEAETETETETETKTETTTATSESDKA